MKKILVVAPHPDDETLGCGGTILKHKENGDIISWLIVTGISLEAGNSPEKVDKREDEIEKVAGTYGFDMVINLRLPTTRLDTIPIGDLVNKMSKVIEELQPEIIYLPYRGDIHTDHNIVFDAMASCTKWFRHKSIKRILSYETLSETDFSLSSDGFKPNVFIDISNYVDEKIKIMKIYASEMGDFPFPRSEQAIRALSSVRGAAAGCSSAEAFILLKEIF